MFTIVGYPPVQRRNQPTKKTTFHSQFLDGSCAP